MNTKYKMGLVLLTGIALGAAAVQGLHAQAKPKAYLVTESEVIDAGRIVKSEFKIGPMPPGVTCERGRLNDEVEMAGQYGIDWTTAFSRRRARGTREFPAPAESRHR